MVRFFNRPLTPFKPVTSMFKRENLTRSPNGFGLNANMRMRNHYDLFNMADTNSTDARSSNSYGFSQETKENKIVHRQNKYIWTDRPLESTERGKFATISLESRGVSFRLVSIAVSTYAFPVCEWTAELCLHSCIHWCICWNLASISLTCKGILELKSLTQIQWIVVCLWHHIYVYDIGEKAWIFVCLWHHIYVYDIGESMAL